MPDQNSKVRVNSVALSLKKDRRRSNMRIATVEAVVCILYDQYHSQAWEKGDDKCVSRIDYHLRCNQLYYSLRTPKLAMKDKKWSPRASGEDHKYRTASDVGWARNIAIQGHWDGAHDHPVNLSILLTVSNN